MLRPPPLGTLIELKSATGLGVEQQVKRQPTHQGCSASLRLGAGFFEQLPGSNRQRDRPLGAQAGESLIKRAQGFIDHDDGRVVPKVVSAACHIGMLSKAVGPDS